MKKDKSQKVSNEQQAAHQTKQNITESGQRTPVSNKEDESTMNNKDKKPYSHRTGDATNFGERSYRED